MTHPIDEPRNGKRVGGAPAPIEHVLRGCPVHYSAIQGRIAALCLLCARQPIGGEQIAPAWQRVDGECSCVNFVAHDWTLPVLPLERGDAVLGGSPQGVLLESTGVQA